MGIFSYIRVHAYSLGLNKLCKFTSTCYLIVLHNVDPKELFSGQKKTGTHKAEHNSPAGSVTTLVT